MVHIIHLIVHNWKLKLISAIIGTMVWGYVRELKMETMNINIPVVYQNTPASLTWKEEPPRFIKITVRGRQENLKFPTSNLESVVNLGSARKGNRSYKVSFDNRQIPEKIKIIAKPETISINFEAIIEKAVAIVAVIEGEPEAGYLKGKAKITPGKVTLKGPESRVNGIKDISTEVLNVQNRKTDLVGTAKLVVPQGVSALETKTVEVVVAINPENQTGEKVFQNIPVKVINLDPALNVLLSDPEIEVRVRGSQSDLAGMSKATFQAFVNLEGTRFNPKTGSILPFVTEAGIPIVVKTSAGADVDILSLTPEMLTVRFSVKPEFIQNGEQQPVENGASDGTPENNEK